MKKTAIYFLMLISLFACKNETKQEIDLEDNRANSYDQNDGFVTIKGDFVFYDNAAVLQTPKEIYGVVIDENLQLLEQQVKLFKKEATDMVPVTVRVRKFEKDSLEEGWQYKVEIKEILKVEAPNPESEDVIKLSN